MRRLTWILLIATAAFPAAANARQRDPLRGATLQAATGTLTLSESRCPSGSTNCGTTRLTEKFESGPKPRTRAADGQAGFPTGLRISGKGTGECFEESPTITNTAPDGSIQFIGSAARVTPGGFDATRVVAASGRRGVHVAWLEPFAPALACDYFGEQATTLVVPVLTQFRSSLIGARTLKRSRFSVTIAGSQEWTKAAADGTPITGRASWRLRLSYKRS